MTTLKEFLERMEKERKKIKPPPKTWDRQDPSVWFDKKKDITTPKKNNTLAEWSDIILKHRKPVDPLTKSLEALHMVMKYDNWDLVAERFKEQRLEKDEIMEL